MNIAVCTLAIGDRYKQIVEPCQQTKIVYCERWGYKYIDDDSVYDKSRPIAWSKVLLLQKYLSNFDYIVWIDADAMIMNYDQNLEDKIRNLMGCNDMMVVSDWKMINSGVWFLKNTPYTHQFLERLYAKTEFINSSNWEQDAIVWMHKNEADVKDHLLVLPHHYESQIQSYWYAFHPGHFILHFCGYRNKYDCLDRDIKKHCSVQLPHETDSQYQERIDYINNGGYRNYVNECMSRN